MAFPVSVSLTCRSRAVPRGCMWEQPRSLAGPTATAMGAPSPAGTPAAQGGPEAGCSPAAVRAMVCVLPVVRKVLGMLSSLWGRAKLSSYRMTESQSGQDWKEPLEII